LLLPLLASVLFVALGTGGYRRHLWLGGDAAAGEVAADAEARVRGLERRLANQRPRGTYVLIDTFANRLHVMRDDDVLRSAVCSTGSGVVLRDVEGGRQWVFDTPLGERRVQRKVSDPVWVKPDWAFIEEGYQPPPAGARERYDGISLGDYALYLGDGYLIHGTLFQSLLGRGVTHGCIRLGDEDLEYVYRTVPRGASVILY
jgi:L,D-transpeptidase YbiS